MRFKAFQWLVAPLLLVTFSVPGWAQPRLVGKEFQVNQNREHRQVAPVTAFSPFGHALIVWENSIHGLLGRFYDRSGNPVSKEILLVANKRLPTIPASGEVLIRKEPAFVFLPNGELLLFWTEEKDDLVIDHFYEKRTILDQDVRGQRFSAEGAPLGASFLVSPATGGFQRRPKAVLRSGGVMVVWEEGATWRDSLSVHGRFLTRRGLPQGGVIRIDSVQASEIRNLAIAANASGEALVAWEADHGTDPNVVALFFDRDGAARGTEIVAHASRVGRQRRPAVLATQKGDFLVAWQSYLTGGSVHGIFGQLYSSAGARVGSEHQFSHGVGEVQISPALALLPSGNIVVTWMDWINTTPIGVFAVLIDRAGNRLGDEIKISQARVVPQYQTSVAAHAHGEIVAVWEGLLNRGWSIAARRLQVD
jgi:hypothetical protein